MNEKYFWAFLILALVVGAAIGIAYTNLRITGYAVSDTSQTNPWWNPFSETTVFSDTDNGVKISAQGTCTGANGEFSDVCIDSTILREYYIAGENCLSMNYNCKALGYEGCSNGFCVSGLGNAFRTETIPTAGLEEVTGVKFFGTLSTEVLDEVNTLMKQHELSVDQMECRDGFYVTCCWSGPGGQCYHGCCFRTY